MNSTDRGNSKVLSDKFFRSLAFHLFYLFTFKFVFRTMSFQNIGENSWRVCLCWLGL